MSFRNCLIAFVLTIIGFAPMSSIQIASAGCGSNCSVNYSYNGCSGNSCNIDYNKSSLSYYPGQWIQDNQHGWVQVISVGAIQDTPAVQSAKVKAPISIADEKKVAPAASEVTKPSVKKPKAPTNRDE